MENSDDNDKEIDKHAMVETSDKTGTETPKQIKKTSRRAKSHVCKTCDKSFHTKNSLKNHIRNIHEKSEYCQICGKGYGSEKLLNIHVKVVHEKRKDYQCEFCQKSFGLKGHVQRHIDTVHLKKKEHKCEYCDKAFGLKSHLYNHVKNRSCKKSKYLKKQGKKPILPKPIDKLQFENKQALS